MRRAAKGMMGVIAVAAATVASADIAVAQPVAASAISAERFAGTYRYAGGEQEVRQLDAAIEAVVSRMNFFIRGIARRRLRQPNLPSEALTIVVDGGRITIARPGRPTVSAPADGRDTEWRHPDGDRFVVSHAVEGDALVQRFRGSSSLSINRFRLGAGGRLTVETAITDTHLPAPLMFRTTYARP